MNPVFVEYRTITVLLIEDNPADREFLQELFSKSENPSFRLICTDRLASGLSYIAKGGIDLILLDLSLPDSQGLETVVKVHMQAPDIPVVVLTGVDDEVLAIKAFREGVQDYLLKNNISNTLLPRSVIFALERHRLLKELERVWHWKQEVRERSEAARDYRHYVEMSQAKEASNQNAFSQPDEKVLARFLPVYRDMLIQYVRAIRLFEPRPSPQVQELACRLAEERFRARDLIRIHLAVLNELSARILLPEEERALSTDARLVLVELMGHLLDIYRQTPKASSGRRKKNKS